MKKKFLLVALVAIIGLIGMSCASVRVPVAVTTNAIGTKTGVAEGNTKYLGIFGSELDASAAAAAKNGNISKIGTVDFAVRQGILGLWVHYKTTVTGE